MKGGNMVRIILFLAVASFAQKGDGTNYLLSYIGDNWIAMRSSFVMERDAINAKDEASGLLYSGINTVHIRDALVKDANIFYASNLAFTKKVLDSGYTIKGNLVDRSFVVFGDSLPKYLSKGATDGDAEGKRQLIALVASARSSLAGITPIAIRIYRRPVKINSDEPFQYDLNGRHLKWLLLRHK